MDHRAVTRMRGMEMKGKLLWLLAIPLLWLDTGIARGDYPIEVIELRALGIHDLLPAGPAAGPPAGRGRRDRDRHGGQPRDQGCPATGT